VCRGYGITRRRKPLRNGRTKVSGFHNIFYK
jgi:RNA recognition motif-containing protein